METKTRDFLAHLVGEPPAVDSLSAIADTFAGRVHVEWDAAAPVAAFGQLPFFIDDLKQAGLFDAWVADCPLSFTSPNAASKRDLLGSVMLSVLSGHRRYAHITALRCDQVNPPLLGMSKVVSEDAVRRGLAKINEAKGLSWLQIISTTARHLCWASLGFWTWTAPPSRSTATRRALRSAIIRTSLAAPSYAYQTYFLSNLRLVLRVDVLPGNAYNVSHATDGLWNLLDHLGPTRRPALLGGDASWDIERVMARAEREELPYLLRFRITKNVRRSLERMMLQSNWKDAGQGWQGNETSLRLVGLSRHRRIILLRR